MKLIGKNIIGKRTNLPALFRSLFLQQLFELIDKVLKFQVFDSCSFNEFVRIRVINNILDALSVTFSRDRTAGFRATTPRLLLMTTTRLS